MTRKAKPAAPEQQPLESVDASAHAEPPASAELVDEADDDDSDAAEAPSGEPVTALALRQDLARIDTALTEFEKVEAGIADLETKYKNTVYPVTTTKGMADAIAARAAIRTPRVAVEKARKAGKAPIIALGRNIQQRATLITARLSAIEVPIHQQIKVEQDRKDAEAEARREAERKRIADIQVLIADTFTNVPVTVVGKTSAEIDDAVVIMVAALIDTRFGDFQAEAGLRKAEALQRLRGLKAMAEQAEAREQRARDELAALEDRRREQVRVEGIQQRMAKLTAGAEGLAGNTSDEVAAVMAELQLEKIDEQDYAEYTAAATEVRQKTLEKLEHLRSATAAQEAEQRRLAVDRAELAAQQEAQRQEQARLDKEAAERREREDQESRQRRAEEDRVAGELRQRNEMAMQEIQGINQQVIIAQIGRAGVRAGGTIECIRDTLAETEEWVIDDDFGILKSAAQHAKDSAVANIKVLLATAEKHERDVAEAAAREAADREAWAERERQEDAARAATLQMRLAAPRMLATLASVRLWHSAAVVRLKAGKPLDDDIVEQHLELVGTITGAIDEAAGEDARPGTTYVVDGIEYDVYGVATGIGVNGNG